MRIFCFKQCCSSTHLDALNLQKAPYRPRINARVAYVASVSSRNLRSIKINYKYKLYIFFKINETIFNTVLYITYM